MMDVLKRIGSAIVRANWAETHPSNKPCPDEEPGIIVMAETLAATNEMISILYELDQAEAADVIRDLAASKCEAL